jgi:hypothetical protein
VDNAFTQARLRWTQPRLSQSQCPNAQLQVSAWVTILVVKACARPLATKPSVRALLVLGGYRLVRQALASNTWVTILVVEAVARHDASG